jgi:hypothetical protein
MFRHSLWIGLLILIGCSRHAPQQPIRYQLHVGQQLVYTGHTEFRGGGQEHYSQESVTYWVVEEKPDQSWRLIAHGVSRFGVPPTDEPFDAQSPGKEALGTNPADEVLAELRKSGPHG